VTLTDDEARAIDEAARVLMAKCRDAGMTSLDLHVRGDGRVRLHAYHTKGFETSHEYADLVSDSVHPSPGAALRRLVGR
jgi:hypothetical protein